MAQVAAGGSRVLTYLDREIVDSLEDFKDPSQEWRRLFSEFLGTFFLVLVAAGGGMTGRRSRTRSRVRLRWWRRG